MTTQTTKFAEVITDFENNSENFWNAVYQLQEEGNELAKLLESDRIVVTEDEANQIKELVETLPGWDDPQAAEFAPHPLLFEDVDKDFREEGYDSFSTEEGTETPDSYRPSDYADFPEMSAAAEEQAKDLFDQGVEQNRDEWRERCESLYSELCNLLEATGGPWRGEKYSPFYCALTDQAYGVRMAYDGASLDNDFLSLWDGTPEYDSQNPYEDDGKLESDLEEAAKTSPEAKEVFDRLRAIESEYSNKGYAEAIAR